MSQTKDERPEKSETKSPSMLQTFEKLDKPLSFDDLVLDGSLLPVKVRLSRKKKEKQPYENDGLLTELQCEV